MATGTSITEPLAPPTLDDLVRVTGVPLQKLDEPCSDEHLIDISSDLVYWQTVAPYLGLKEAEVEVIEVNANMVQERRLKALRKWKNKYSFKATYRALTEVLLKCHMADNAEKVCRLLVARHDQVPRDDSKPTHDENGVCSTADDASRSLEVPITDNDHIQNLLDEIHELERKYEDLMDEVEDNLTKAGTDLLRIKNRILRLPVSLKHSHWKLLEPEAITAIENTTSIRMLFTLLHNQYWDFLNCDLLCHIVDRCGDPETIRSKEKYLDELRRFRRKTKLRDLIQWTGTRYTKSYEKHFEKKLGETWTDRTVEDFEQFRIEFSRQCSINSYAVRTQDVKDGCIAVTLALPASVDIAALCLQDLWDFLKQHDVLKIIANGNCIIDTTIPKVAEAEQGTPRKEEELPQLLERMTTTPDILSQYLPDMKRLLDIKSISKYLVAAGSMTLDEKRQLETAAQQSREALACNFVDLINKGGQTSQEAFFTVLRHSAEDDHPGHKELLKILKDSLTVRRDSALNSSDPSSYVQGEDTQTNRQESDSDGSNAPDFTLPYERERERRPVSKEHAKQEAADQVTDGNVCSGDGGSSGGSGGGGIGSGEGEGDEEGCTGGSGGGGGERSGRSGASGDRRDGNDRKPPYGDGGPNLKEKEKDSRSQKQELRTETAVDSGKGASITSTESGMPLSSLVPNKQTTKVPVSEFQLKRKQQKATITSGIGSSLTSSSSEDLGSPTSIIVVFQEENPPRTDSTLQLMALSSPVILNPTTSSYKKLFPRLSKGESQPSSEDHPMDGYPEQESEVHQHHSQEFQGQPDVEDSVMEEKSIFFVHIKPFPNVYSDMLKSDIVPSFTYTYPKQVHGASTAEGGNHPPNQHIPYSIGYPTCAYELPLHSLVPDLGQLAIPPHQDFPVTCEPVQCTTNGGGVSEARGERDKSVRSDDGTAMDERDKLMRGHECDSDIDSRNDNTKEEGRV